MMEVWKRPLRTLSGLPRSRDPVAGSRLVYLVPLGEDGTPNLSTQNRIGSLGRRASDTPEFSVTGAPRQTPEYDQ